MSEQLPTMKDRLRADLTTAMKARDSLRSSTIRMVLAAITEAEVAGSEPVVLTDAQVTDVLARETKKRREAHEAFAAAGRDEMAAKEEAESAILVQYLPQQLGSDEITSIVAAAVESSGAKELGMKGMGAVMGLVTPQTKGRADGKAVAAEVRRQLA